MLQYRETGLWKSLWKLWITHCKKLLLQELCKCAKEKRETSGKVKKNAMKASFCHFFDKKTDAHSVEKKKNQENFV